jgi:hypothetical protein
MSWKHTSDTNTGQIITSADYAATQLRDRFDAIARSICENCGIERLNEWAADSDRDVAALFSEALQNAWRERGEADAKAVEERLATLTGWLASEPYRQQLREAIKAVDR